ncbi:MAG: DUF4159 domain-containing protein [Elusimicrobia bacterium]|nr:DUF4159 domain-containing protein [Candidatus Obscuribacterium magneticum]
MTFLNPAFLWGLPLTLIPIVLHLLYRKPHRRFVFSHIKWLRLAHQKFMPRRRFRDILLMVLRTLIILILVSFFSRPVLHRGGPFTSASEDATLILLVDVSASMGAIDGGRPALQLAVDSIKRLFRGLPAGEKVGLVATSDRVEREAAPTMERAKIISVLEELKVTPRSTDNLPALKLAYGMLANQPKTRKSILVVTDNALNGWVSAMESAGRWEAYDPEVSLVIWEIVEPLPNRGITDAFLHLSEEGALKGRFSLWHHEGSFLINNAWEMMMNQKTIAQGNLQGKRGEEEEIPLEARLPEGGYFSGRVQLTADNLPFDDVYYLAGRVPIGFRLLIVDGESGLAPSDAESYYLRLALESPRDPRLEAVDVIRPDALLQGSLSNYQVIVLANAAVPSEVEANMVKWVEGGGGLLLTAGGRWSNPPEVPLKFFRTKKGPAKEETVGAPDPKASLISGLDAPKEFQWDDIKVNHYVPLEAESGLDPLLLLKNGDPLLAAKRIGKGFVLCLTTTLDRQWTNLPAKPIFSPLMRELIASLADPLREQTSLNGFVDEPLKIKLREGVRNITVLKPDGSSSGANVDENGFLDWPHPALPGLYHVRTQNKDSDFSFAINMKDQRGEGDTKRISDGELKTIFPKALVQTVSSKTRRTEQALAALEGWDATPLLINALIVLFLLETLIGWKLKDVEKVFGAILLVILLSPGLQAGTGNNFIYTQLKYDGAWDPYPQINQKIDEMVRSMTNIPIGPDRKVVTLTDPALFEIPFLLVKGNSEFRVSPPEKRRLKQFIDQGGFVFFDDTLAEPKGPFARSIRALMAELYPDRSFQQLPMDHALFRSFFLLRNVAGRRISEKYFEGLDVGGRAGGEGRTAVVYSPNDLLGAWMKDQLGQYVYSCEPGGETQRWEAFKLTINVIYFSLTGTYKRDAVHQPFIERKLGM